MSGVPKLTALCLKKQTSEAWSNFIDYRSSRIARTPSSGRATPFYGVLTNNHADASSRRNSPGGGLVIRRAGEEGGKLGAVVARDASVGEAQPLLARRLVGVNEAVAQCVPLPGSRLGLHLEEPTLLTVFGLDLHVLTAAISLEHQALLRDLEANRAGERLAVEGHLALEDRNPRRSDREVLVRPRRVSAGMPVVEDSEVTGTDVELDVGTAHLNGWTYLACGDGSLLVSRVGLAARGNGERLASPPLGGLGGSGQ